MGEGRERERGRERGRAGERVSERERERERLNGCSTAYSANTVTGFAQA